MDGKLRSILLTILLGAPAVALLAFGPRGQVHVPPGKTVVRYWEKWSGVEGQAMQRLVDRFNETVGAEQGLWVEYAPISDVDKRLLIATAGGDPPDVAGLFDHVIPQFADRDALMPLDDLVAEFGIDLSVLKPVWIDICRFDGRLYALPSTPYTIALFYNRRLFREAGLDPDRPPQTTAELNEYALRLTKKDERGRIKQLGFTTSPAMLGWWHWIWPCFFDGQLWDGDRFTVDTPAGNASVEWTVARRKALGNREVLEFEASAGAIEGAQNPFLSERLAMVFQGPWMSNWAATYTPNLDYGVAAFPSVTTDRRNVFASTDLFVIPRGSKRPREAMVFLRWLMRQEVLEDLCQAHGKGSPFVSPRPEFYANHRNRMIRVFDEIAASPAAFGYPKMPMWAEAWSEMLSLHESVLRGVVDPHIAIRQTQAKMDRVVRDYQHMRALRKGEPPAAITSQPVAARTVRPRRRVNRAQGRRAAGTAA